MSTVSTTDGNALASQEIATSNLGPVFVGWILQLIFYGWAISLLFSYLTGAQYKSDSRRIKIWLWAVAFFTSAQSIISFESLYHYGTSQQRDETTLYSQTFTDCFATLPAGLVGALVQSFLTLRAVSLFSNRIYRATFIGVSVILILGGLVGSWLFVAVSFLSRNNVNFPPGMSFRLATGLWLWCCCVMDVLITVTLSILLYSRIVGFNSRTDSTLRSVIVLSIETASYTATFSCIAAILSDSFSDDSLFSNTPGTFFQPLSSFYMISFLVTLESRQRLRQKAHGYTNDAETPNVFAARYPSTGGISKPAPPTTHSTRARSPTPQLVMMKSMGERRSDDEDDDGVQLPPKCEKDLRIEM